MDPVRRRDLVYGGHVVLAILLLAARMIASTPGIASWNGGDFASTPPGRFAALCAVLLGVAALGTVLGLTLTERRDRRLGVLLLLLALATAQRERFDVFDLVYVLAVAGLALLW